jgi:hypothetical protein
MPLNSPEDWKTALADTWMLDYVRDVEVPASLDAALSNEGWYSIFYFYAQSEFATESLDFIATAGTFAENGDLGLAQQIYDTFVSANAEKQVNLSSATRGPIDAALGVGGEGHGPPSLFDGAVAEVKRMMAADTFRRFQTSAGEAQRALAEAIDWDNVQGR